MGGRVEAQEGLLDPVGERLDEPRCIVWSVAQAAGGVAHVFVVEGVYFGSEEGGENDGLAEVGRAAVEVPRADSGEVAAVGVLGL